jgi:hypothetical protein
VGDADYSHKIGVKTARRNSDDDYSHKIGVKTARRNCGDDYSHKIWVKTARRNSDDDYSHKIWVKTARRNGQLAFVPGGCFLYPWPETLDKKVEGSTHTSSRMLRRSDGRIVLYVPEEWVAVSLGVSAW